MKRKSGIILLAVFAGLLAFAGVVGNVGAAQVQRMHHTALPENGDFLNDTEPGRHNYDAHISTSMPHAASPEFHSPASCNSFAGRSVSRSLHKIQGFISFKAGKLMDLRVLMLYVGKLQLLPSGFSDSSKSFIRLGRLII